MLAANEETKVTWGVHLNKTFKGLPASYLHWVLTHITSSASPGLQSLYFWANRHFEVQGALLLRRVDNTILYPDARYGEIFNRVKDPVTPIRPKSKAQPRTPGCAPGPNASCQVRQT
jgi:hypothetical protein